MRIEIGPEKQTHKQKQNPQKSLHFRETQTNGSSTQKSAIASMFFFFFLRTTNIKALVECNSHNMLAREGTPEAHTATEQGVTRNQGSQKKAKKEELVQEHK